MAPPYATLQVGSVTGGQAVNIIPDRADAAFELRAIAGQGPRALMTPLLMLPGVEAEWLATYPALALDVDDTHAALVEEILGSPAVEAVFFGTKAGLFQQAGTPAIVCRPRRSPARTGPTSTLPRPSSWARTP